MKPLERRGLPKQAWRFLCIAGGITLFDWTTICCSLPAHTFFSGFRNFVRCCRGDSVLAGSNFYFYHHAGQLALSAGSIFPILHDHILY